MRKIRVLVVEDSVTFRKLLVQNLNEDPMLEVVAAARDPYEARDMIVKYQPDVMTLDIELPRMNGIEFLRKLMPQHPIPVVVISALTDKVFDALNAGAVDFAAKPSARNKEQIAEFIHSELPVKIKIASTAKISNIKRSIDLAEPVAKQENESVIAIGASTGGTEAICSVLKRFTTDMPGVVIVQHMPAGFTEMYARRLNDNCAFRVKEAQHGDKVLPGHALLAPGGERHMRLVKINGYYQVELKEGDKVNGHKPSADILFQSVAKAAGSNAMGVILTGMGGDGARGLLAMRQAGAVTIGQDEASCVVYGMPKVAYDLGAVMYQESLDDIPARIRSLLNKAK